jgi:hypothetical protein
MSRKTASAWMAGVSLLVISGAYASASPPDAAAAGARTSCCTYRVRSVTALPGGGTRTTYANGVSELTPGPYFNVLTASRAELSLYGITPEPARGRSRAQWLRMARDLHWARAPEEIRTGPRRHEFSTGYSDNWAGYVALEPLGYFHWAQGAYVQPARHPSRCDSTPGAFAGFWIGIGTTQTKDPSLGQQGTDMNGSAWIETNFGNVSYTGMHVAAGTLLYMTTHWTGEGYTYYFHNMTTGLSGTWDASSGNVASGQYTAYIAEMPAPWTALANFGTMLWEEANATASDEEIFNWPTEKLIMRAGDGDVLATPSNLADSPVAFTVTQNTCN